MILAVSSLASSVGHLAAQMSDTSATLNSVGQYRELQMFCASADRVSGFSHELQILPSSEPECQDTLFPNTNFPGHDIEVHPAASPELCQLLCNTHPRCTYFSFVSNGFKCYLKNNPNEMVPNYTDNVTSGLPSRSCPLRNERKPFFIDQIIEYSGVDFPFSDIRYFQQDDATSCGNACTEDPNCQFYSYITTRFNNTHKQASVSAEI
ncbi:hypothetical protein ILYODFUR_028745 [Ilyodon furcidens]|uniref:Apple domain-containing protein n=1 Tax=Ilyodon furcidens TaxID=33524 RepID=A0ABV0TNL0_9TELE